MAKVHDSAMTTRRRRRRRPRVERRGRRVPHWEVAIIGAGPGGLGLAIQLVKSRRRDFVLFEASDGVGGTWRTQHLPRRRLRRAVAPLLLLLRPEARLDQDVRQTSPRSSATSRTAPTASASAPTCGRTPASRRRSGTTGRGAGGSPTPGAAPTRPTCSCQRHRDLHDAVGARHRGSRRPSPAPASTRRAGSTSTTWRAAGWPSSGRGPARRRSSPSWPRARGRSYVFQRTPQWILPRSDKPFTEEQKRRFARNPHRHAASPPGDLLGLREHHRVPPRRGRAPSSSRRLRSATSTTGSRTTSCGPR